MYISYLFTYHTEPMYVIIIYMSGFHQRASILHVYKCYTHSYHLVHSYNHCSYSFNVFGHSRVSECDFNQLKGMRMVHMNIRSMVNKFSEVYFCLLLASNSPEVLILADSRRMRNGVFQAYPRGGSTVAPVPTVAH